MASMLEEIAGALGGDTLGQLAGALGADNDALGRGVAAALPAILGGLARNSRQPDGAGALASALGNHHDGSILDSLGSVFGGSPWAQKQATRDGDKILGHVFGQARPQVEQHVAQSSGLSSGIVKQLLPLLAPVILGYIGRRLTGGDSQAVASSLQQERQQVQASDGVFGQVLDMLDGDSSNGGAGLIGAAGDLLTGPAGRAILGQLLGGR